MTGDDALCLLPKTSFVGFTARARRRFTAHVLRATIDKEREPKIEDDPNNKDHSNHQVSIERTNRFNKLVTEKVAAGGRC
jgi:hypothetical protein